MTRTDSFHFDFSDTGRDSAMPSEEVTLNYEKIEWTYRKIEANGRTDYAADRLEGTQTDHDQVTWTYSEVDHLVF